MSIHLSAKVIRNCPQCRLPITPTNGMAEASVWFAAQETTFKLACCDHCQPEIQSQLDELISQHPGMLPITALVGWKPKLDTTPPLRELSQYERPSRSVTVDMATNCPCNGCPYVPDWQITTDDDLPTGQCKAPIPAWVLPLLPGDVEISRQLYFKHHWVVTERGTELTQCEFFTFLTDHKVPL